MVVPNPIKYSARIKESDGDVNIPSGYSKPRMQTGSPYPHTKSALAEPLSTWVSSGPLAAPYMNVVLESAAGCNCCRCTCKSRKQKHRVQLLFDLSRLPHYESVGYL